MSLGHESYPSIQRVLDWELVVLRTLLSSFGEFCGA